MLAFYDRPTWLCQGMARREWLKIGGLGAIGLSLPNLLRARETAPLGIPPTDKTFGRAKNVIFLFLAGGPPQHETFDPKPDAPAEIRGPFKPIRTNVPGIHFCELLPRTARIADKLAVCRSLSTDDNNHDSSGYQVLTGYKYVGPNSRTIQPTDWPYFGSIIKRYRPSELLPPLSTVWIPDMFRLNENVTPAGQTAGIMGGQWDPDRFVGDPSETHYRVDGLKMERGSVPDLERRRRLLAKIEGPFEAERRGPEVRLYDGFQEQAFDLLTSGKAQAAFEIGREPERIRARYGNNSWGQSVLLARRLIEAGVRLVHVQWPREPGDNAVDNPLWDTHAQNADRLEDVLCPQFDLGYTALIEDLNERGLLDETLVVAVGEFGRTPKINKNGGRDHWGHVFSFVLAGAGISGGQVYGTSDKQGGYPLDNRVLPGEFTATLFHLMGLDYQSTFHDLQGREHRVTEGKPVFKLLGVEPATAQRVESTGDLARFPSFDPNLTLVQTAFSSGVPVQGVTASSRPKGWRADPLVGSESGATEYGVLRLAETALLGMRGGSRQTPLTLSTGALATLAQEVRSPFAGTYELTVRLRGRADSAQQFADLFEKHFACRLQFFQFTDSSKNVLLRKELAAVDVQPHFANEAGEFKSFQLTKEFINPTPGGNFSFGIGMGVAVNTVKTSEGPTEFSLGSACTLGVEVLDVRLKFTGKPRNEKVQV